MNIATKRRIAGIGAAALSIAAFAAPAAQAAPGIGLHGPLTERYGFFPEYYQDGSGNKLQLCLTQVAGCGAVVAPGPGPISFPGNFPDELFYWSANATVAGISLTLAQEATFDGTDGSQAVFGRLRMRGAGLTAGQWYRYTTPYGQFDFQAEAGPRSINVSRDTGCGPAIGPVCATDADFGLVGASDIGPNFLTWPDLTDPALAGGFVGDGATPHVVTGSTLVPDAASINPPDPCDPIADPTCTPATPDPVTGLPANYFRIDRITGDGGTVIANVGQTDEFVVTGQFADDPAQPYLLTTSGDAGAQPIADGAKAYALTVRNGGSADLKIDTAAVDANPDFAVTGTDCTNNTVTPAGRTQAPAGASQTCTVNVAFDPATSGTKTATLHITEQAGGAVHDIALTGVGTQPVLGSDQDGLSFGVQAVGTTAPTMTATVRNTGNAPLLVNGATLSGAEAGDFAIVDSTCTGTTLAPTRTCTIDVQFTPTASSVRNVSLNIASAVGSRSLSLSGVGSAAPAGPTVIVIQQQVPAGGGAAGAAAGGDPAATGGAGTTAKLTLRRLGTAKKIKLATARKQGIRLRMELLSGTEVIKIDVYRRGGGKLKLVSSGFKAPGRTGSYTVRQNHAALRNALKRGIYEVHVTPGRSKSDLGTTSKFAFTVT